jgi:hypothetical protein
MKVLHAEVRNFDRELGRAQQQQQQQQRQQSSTLPDDDPQLRALLERQRQQEAFATEREDQLERARISVREKRAEIVALRQELEDCRHERDMHKQRADAPKQQSLLSLPSSGSSGAPAPPPPPPKPAQSLASQTLSSHPPEQQTAPPPQPPPVTLAPRSTPPLSSQLLEGRPEQPPPPPTRVAVDEPTNSERVKASRSFDDGEANTEDSHAAIAMRSPLHPDLAPLPPSAPAFEGQAEGPSPLLSSGPAPLASGAAPPVHMLTERPPGSGAGTTCAVCCSLLYGVTSCCGKCGALAHAPCIQRTALDAHKPWTCADCQPTLLAKRPAAAAPAKKSSKLSKRARLAAQQQQQNLLSLV